MKKLLAAVVIVAAFAVSASAQSPIKFSLFDQVAWPQTEKANLGLGLLYSNTPEVSGLDFNLFVSKVDNLTGVQLSAVNINDKGQGAHLGVVNYGSGDLTGFQYGFVNYANSFKGLQLGFVNYINTIDKGLQIGLVNVIRNNGWLPFMVIVNGRF
ncbi:MAG: hypothetical protein LBL61_01670 [Elusimicrobiota bacterium]|jgi:hypothetical protein|nr:hypothetical protein [Elusimicrobiota bacterium]